MQPWAGLQYGVRGKTAVIACQKIEKDKVKSVYVNRRKEFDNQLAEFNILCDRLYFGWYEMIENP